LVEETPAANPEQTDDISFTESQTNAIAETTVETSVEISETKKVNTKRLNCSKPNQWQKSVTIMAMPRATPTQSNAGNFYQAETYIPRMLAKELQKSIGVESRLLQQISGRQLAEEQKRQQIRSIAQQQSTQFVLVGEILDISMRDTTSVYSPDFLQKLRNHFTDITMIRFSDNRDRVFSLYLELRDGFTGEILMADSFQTSGIWKNAEPVGFTSRTVWKSQYGQRIQKLIQKAGNQLADNLKCQPYMARVEVNQGQTELLLQGGANNGLHPGDNLKLYQLVVMASPGQYDSYHTRLIKRDLQLELKEVYPSHSFAQLRGDDMLNGQYLAVGEE
jgi:hypothetical protein